MASSIDRTLISASTALQIDISATEMKTNKKYKAEKIDEIISAICALLNSGGMLELRCHDVIHHDVISNYVRTIEQRVKEIIGSMMMLQLLLIEENDQNVMITVKQSPRLITVNYNMYLPSRSEVNAVQPLTLAEQTEEYLKRKIIDDCVVIGSHKTPFRKGTKSGLKEEEVVQLKNLKSDASKSTTLADRMAGKNNKFPSYVSAFANHRGGHIYYGISDKGIVEGQRSVRDKHKYEIRNKVAKAIKKMIWPQGEPQKGAQWEIFFEPVLDDDNNPIPYTFVIVIFIAPCPGGVFTEEPESYHIVGGEVTRMSFEIWRRNLTGQRAKTENTSLITKAGFARVRWSSERNRELFRKLSSLVLQCRNDKNFRDLEKLGEKVKTKFPGTNVHLIVLGECIMAAHTEDCPKKARKLLKEYERLLPRAEDSQIFEGRMLQLKSRMERRGGTWKESYETTQDGLQKMAMLPVEMPTVFYYMEACLITLMMSVNDEDMVQRKRALQYLELAENYRTSIEDNPTGKASDLQQKYHTYKAMTLLGCSVTGEVVSQILPAADDIEDATKELVEIDRSVLRGSHFTHFRQAEYNLAKCDLLRRRGEVFQDDSALREAFRLATRTKDLARQHHFENFLQYAATRQANLIVILIRKALSSRKRCLSITERLELELENLV